MKLSGETGFGSHKPSSWLPNKQDFFLFFLLLISLLPSQLDLTEVKSVKYLPNQLVDSATSNNCSLHTPEKFFLITRSIFLVPSVSVV